MSFLIAALLLPTLFWDRGPETAVQLEQAHIHSISVPTANAAAWKTAGHGITVEAIDVDQLKKIPALGVKPMRGRFASPTQRPWVDSNGWRFLRDSKSTYLYDVKGDAAALAAAEAFTYGVDAAVKTDDGGVKAFGAMLEFLRSLKVVDGPAIANIGYIDDGSPASGEFMNLLVRRNLLFRTVAAPNPALEITVKLGTPQYPLSEAGNPNLLAEKVRDNLTDEKRLLRVYGSELVVGRLVGTNNAATMYLLNYGAGRIPVEGLRVRVLGDYRKWTIFDYGSSEEKGADPVTDHKKWEVTLKRLPVFAVVNLSN